MAEDDETYEEDLELQEEPDDTVGPEVPTEPAKRSATILDVKVQLADYWNHYMDQEGEWHPEGERVDPIFAAVVHQLVDRLVKDRDIYSPLSSTVRNIREELIRQKLEPVIQEALEASIQRTNTYGEACGKTVTLREHIVEESRKILKEVRGDSYDRNRGTLLQRILREQVDSVFKKELLEEINAAKASTRAAVRNEAATVIAETVQRVAKTTGSGEL